MAEVSASISCPICGQQRCDAAPSVEDLRIQLYNRYGGSGADRRIDEAEHNDYFRAITTHWKAEYDEIPPQDGPAAGAAAVFLRHSSKRQILVEHGSNCTRISLLLFKESASIPQLVVGQDGIRFRGAPVVGSRFSWDMIRQWISECNSEHDHAKDMVHHLASPLPQGFMVIDVVNGCVVNAPPECHYIALSYVWGQLHNDDVIATSKTLESLRQQHSLGQRNLPATIWDSMTVCQALGVQFLWVDRLCIIQDGEAQKMEQIRAMDAIYSRAAFTICAASSSSSDSGLHGAKDTPRTFFQGHVKINDFEVRVRLPDNFASRSQTWWKRAWTCQELFLSSRKLIVSPWQISFHCPRNIEFEEGTTGFGGGLFSAKSSAFETYMDFISQYNQRELTIKEDIFNAFQGLFKRAYGSLKYSIHGLPEPDFDSAILWDVSPIKPEDVDPDPIRRPPPSASQDLAQGGLGRHRQRIPRQSDRVVLPSWSWVQSRGYATWIGTLLRSTSTGRGDAARIIASLARWNIVEQGAERPRAILAQGSIGREEDENRWQIYAWSAWAKKCLEEDLPSELQDASNLSRLKERVVKRWPTYADYWQDALASPSPWICGTAGEIALAREKPGRIILRSTLATLRLDYRDCCLRSPNGEPVGILVDHHNCEQMMGKKWTCAALASGPAISQMLKVVTKANDDTWGHGRKAGANLSNATTFMLTTLSNSE
ncbi:hypothetical protein J7T55_010823 [Diaporthe amygdali]|uniref:uncharacterized protein n=1 Tax=Phomopsis amygdali TaxID=1214568 RepID=UPI0022FE7165|nr:uncharacterized protein J7T55_010823 [Diaporthe amygdali]KAJ0114434.1 hypothetical protein J7T55_010823 [Diaporthe amygdali]